MAWILVSLDPNPTIGECMTQGSLWKAMRTIIVAFDVNAMSA